MMAGDGGLRLSVPAPEEVLEDVIRQVGYGRRGDVKPEILEEIERSVREGLDLVRPAASLRIVPLLRWEKGVLAGEGIEIRSPRWTRLARRLVEPRRLACFIVTTGDPLDRAITETQASSLFHGYLLDALGSVAAERLADQVDREVAERFAREGCEPTARFSPGYCDWEVGDGQEAIFGLLEPDTAGVRRTGSGMMIPRKSVSAAVIGAAEVPWKTPCRFCPDEDCPYRREPREGKAGGGPVAGDE